MIYWTLWDNATGQIVATGNALDEEQAYLQAGAGGTVTLVNTNPATQQINPTTGAVAARPAATTAASKTAFLANGTDYVRLSPCPAGATISIDVNSDSSGIAPIPTQVIPDGFVDITTTVAGAYVVTITRFPEQDFVVTLNAN